MRFLGFSAVLAGWLVISAFVFPQTATSAMVTVLAAFLSLSFAAFAMGRPGIRYLNAAVAIVLAGFALFGDPGAAGISSALSAAVMFALALVSPHHAQAEPSPAVSGGK